MKKRYVSEKEAQKMWDLYQTLGTYSAVAKKMRRSAETVSRHVSRVEASIGTAHSIFKAQKNT